MEEIIQCLEKAKAAFAAGDKDLSFHWTMVALAKAKSFNTIK